MNKFLVNYKQGENGECTFLDVQMMGRGMGVCVCVGGGGEGRGWGYSSLKILYFH